MTILISLALNNNVEEFECRELQLFLLRWVCACVLPVICCFLLPPPAVAGIGSGDPLDLDSRQKDEEFGPGIGVAAGRMLQINTTLQSLTISCELHLSQEMPFLYNRELLLTSYSFQCLTVWPTTRFHG